MFDDAVSEMNEEIVNGVNSLSNTEEMYILFGQADVSTINNFDIETKADMECCWLDPHIASGVARMPENVINLLDSESEEEYRCEKSEVKVNAKRDADDEDIPLHPLDDLLSLKDDEFTNDDGTLMKIMSIAIQNGAPSNLVKLYLNGYLHKSHILNFIRTSIKNRKRLEIDISEVDFSHGYDASDHIDLISPTSQDTQQSYEDEGMTQEMVVAAATNTSLNEDLPADLRYRGASDHQHVVPSESKEFKPTTTANGNMKLKSHKDYRE